MIDTDCWCIGQSPAGFICTELGFMPTDAGTGGGS